MWGSFLDDLEYDVRAEVETYSSDEEYLAAILARDTLIDERNKQLSEAYGLKAFITVNQLVSVPLSTWLGVTPWEEKFGYSDAVKTALLAEVSSVLEERDRKVRDVETKAKLERQSAGTNIEMPHKLGGIQNYLS